ncbi:MAG: putative lipid II flippase FtsW [Candidatus Dormibacteraeota bacterium]|jgi:cell division protein FtsW|nr:putative lipid II flippase FtsW [Candidatus Dormibacteraeota bacterium]
MSVGSLADRFTGGEDRLETDRWLALVSVLLAGAGLVMVLSSSQALAYLDYRFPLYYFVRQVAFAALGLALMAFLRHLDYHSLRRYAPAAAAVTVVLMVMVLVPGLGLRVNGARRWFSLGPLGSFQPSEVAKLTFVIFMARWVDKRGERLKSFVHGFLPFAILLAAALGILMLQRDLGTALVMCAIFCAVFFAGGGRAGYVVLMVLLLVAAFALFTVFESYRAQRLEVFLDPFKDPLGAGFQSRQAILALGSGGLTGVGLGHSVQKYLWLPEAHTDFIFAIVGEETGLLGTTAVLAAFVLLALRGYRTAMRATDRFGVALAAGITTWIAFQALLNMGTVTDTVPITGVTLPFISYGGTSLAVTMAATGVLLSIAARGGQRRSQARRTDATADIGRRDRRPRAARARGGASLPR